MPGSRLKQDVQCERIGGIARLHIPELGCDFRGLRVSVFLEVEGAPPTTFRLKPAISTS
ncbi:UNVERIFIED_ORG: acetaldehyde dehydrogenase (acetylating) [Rhizobium etli]